MARLAPNMHRLSGTVWRALASIASGGLQVVRGAAGPSYGRYLAHFRSAHGNAAKPLSRREFHQQELDRRYRGISRCC
jgi:uncharacterized short protein YbdD (DUF466 family)